MSDANVLVARVIANLDGLKTGLSAGKIEIEKTSTQLQNLSSSFDGSKLITKATLMVEAINSIGGASVLTEREQRRVNTAVDEAIQRYEALGKQAPADMIALRDATAQTAEKGESFLSTVTKMGAALGITFGAGAIIGQVKALGAEVFNTASQIHDLAEKTGTSAEFIQRMGFAADQSGSNMEAITTAIAKMNALLSEGGTGTLEALHQLGLNFDTIRAMKTEDAFRAITDAIQKVADPMVQAQAAVKLFGKAGQDLLPGIKEGLTSIGNQTEVMSNTTVNRLEAAQDAWEKFGHGVTIVTGTIIGSLIGIGNEITSSTSSWKLFLNDLTSGGLGVALTNAHVRASIADITTELTAAQKVGADFWKKQKDFSIEDAALMLKVSVPSLEAYYKTAKKGTGERLASIADENKAVKEASEVQLSDWSDTVKRQQQLYKDADDAIAKALALQDKDVKDSAELQLDAWNDTVRQHKEAERKATEEIVKYFGDLDDAAMASANSQLDDWNAVVRAHKKAEADANAEVLHALDLSDQAHKRFVDSVSRESDRLVGAIGHGWEGLKGALEGIMNDILQYFEHQLIEGMLLSLLSGTNKMSGMFSGIGSGIGGAVGKGAGAGAGAAGAAGAGLSIGAAIATGGIGLLAAGIPAIMATNKMYRELEAQIVALGGKPDEHYLRGKKGVQDNHGPLDDYRQQIIDLTMKNSSGAGIATASQDAKNQQNIAAAALWKIYGGHGDVAAGVSSGGGGTVNNITVNVDASGAVITDEGTLKKLTDKIALDLPRALGDLGYVN